MMRSRCVQNDVIMGHSVNQEDLKDLLNHVRFNISLAVQITQDLMAWQRDLYK